MADLQTVTKRLVNIGREVKRGDKNAVLEASVLEKVQKSLEEGKLASSVALDPVEKEILGTMHLLTMKPILYALNTSEASSVNKSDIKTPGPFVLIDPVFEKGLDDLIKKSYETLNLITYFTTGEDESRAWTITRGWSAPLAGTAIHTDFKDKFIRAEVVHCDDLLSSGSYAVAREKGLVRTEGKEYIVKDGDVIEFKI